MQNHWYLDAPDDGKLLVLGHEVQLVEENFVSISYLLDCAAPKQKRFCIRGCGSRLSMYMIIPKVRSTKALTIVRSMA